MSKPNRNKKTSAAKPTTSAPAAIVTTSPTALPPSRQPVASVPSPAILPTASAPATGPASGTAKAAAQSIPVQPPRTPASAINSVQIELLKPEAKNVFVAGSFNGWKPESTPLRSAGNGRWVGDLSVQPGRHEYLFVVDGQWLPDPNAKETVANPFGGTNSVLVVKE